MANNMTPGQMLDMMNAMNAQQQQQPQSPSRRVTRITEQRVPDQVIREVPRAVPTEVEVVREVRLWRWSNDGTIRQRHSSDAHCSRNNAGPCAFLFCRCQRKLSAK